MAKKKAPTTIFEVTDFFGNLVQLLPNTWTNHVMVEHPEMAAYQPLVQQTIVNPFEVCESTQYDFGAVFISPPGSGPSPEGIRAVVWYQHWSYQKGAATGLVATAYPIDIVRYGNPKVGKTIYRKGK